MKEKSNKFYYIYVITNKILNKQYVGSRIYYGKDINLDSYMGSSKYLNIDISIYGIKNFAKEILQNNYINSEDMLKDESYYINKYNTLSLSGYNRYDPGKVPGFYMNGKYHSQETKEKLREIQTGKKFSEEHKKKIGNSLLGRKVSQETRERLSLILKGKKRSEETRNKMSKSHLGRIFSEETKQKIQKSNLNKQSGENNPMSRIKISERSRKLDKIINEK